jgi:hypothetical protein
VRIRHWTSNKICYLWYHQTISHNHTKMLNWASISSTQVCSIFLVLTAAYLLASSILQYWRLRKIPGPPLASWTSLWLMWHMHHEDTFHVVRKKLHQKYGPVQRYGPNRVMFSDPIAVPIILGSTDVYPKVQYQHTSLSNTDLLDRPLTTGPPRVLSMVRRLYRSLV